MRRSVPVRVGCAQSGGGDRIGRQFEQHECRQSPFRPLPSLCCGSDEAPQPSHRACRMGQPIISRTREHRNRDSCDDPAPIVPAVKLCQVVGAHQPNEASIRKAAVKRSDSVHRIGTAQLTLDGGHPDRQTARYPLCGGEARRQRCHVLSRFERVARRDEPPDLIEAEQPSSVQAHPAMAAMGRVERAAEQADAGHACRDSIVLAERERWCMVLRAKG